VVVTPPRVTQGPFVTGPELIQTPLRAETATFDVPAGTSVLTEEEVRNRRVARSLPDAMLRLPSTVVQKTGPGQSSPFIRGFTGYHNLLLIDGIRLNNSTFRSGPNQYWSTIDSFTIGRLEVARGPHSVLYGSDAVGGTVNVIPRARESFCCGRHVEAGAFLRYASGESSWIGRAEFEGNVDDVGFLGGFTWKDYGDIESGGGELPETGFHEHDADLRLDWRLTPRSVLTLAWQHVMQEDAPRTHTTVHAVPFHGSAVGTDLKRDLDQQRDLLYLKYAWADAGGLFPTGRATLSYQRQEEDQERLRTGGRLDFSGFTVDTIGASLQLERPTCIGRFTFGFDAYHDEVTSFRDDYLNGVFVSSSIQGPVGDDGTYDLIGVYVQDRVCWRRWEWIAGLHFTYAAADADQVDNPLVAGGDGTVPGNVISVDDEWTALVGSLRTVYHLTPQWNLYGGVSQAFRAPTLTDLTAFEATSVFETPAPDLDPDHYVGFELGAKTEQRCFSGAAAVWYTILQDTIVRSPTGNLIDTVPEVRKDNVGDGWLWGFEVEAAWRWHPAWTAFGNLSWMDGEVDQFDENQEKVRDDFDRLMPLTTLLGLRFEPPCGRIWAQAEWVHAEKADRLSLQNETDTQRIPPGGTPGYDVLNLRAGYRVWRDTSVTLAIENLTDENYRIHGSGVNEPGFNLVVGIDFRW
jgi:hemoglobin/transferrin/lactoferrin receptor protein